MKQKPLILINNAFPAYIENFNANNINNIFFSVSGSEYGKLVLRLCEDYAVEVI